MLFFENNRIVERRAEPVMEYLEVPFGERFLYSDLDRLATDPLMVFRKNTEWDSAATGMNPQERMAIRNNVRNDFARLASQEPSQRVIEPVFIMEVRYLLNIMLEKML